MNIPQGFKDNGEPDIQNVSGSLQKYYRYRAWKDKQEEQERLEWEERQVALTIEEANMWHMVKKFKEQNEQ